MPLSESVQNVIKGAVEAAELLFYGADSVSADRRMTLRVYIDKEGGVDVEDCERASRQVGAAMDVAGLFPNGYILEVSSPGLDRPLFSPAHYMQAVGQKIFVKLKLPKAGQRNFKGQLLEVQEDMISIQTEGKTCQLALSEIQSANIEPDFSHSYARGGSR